MQKYEGKEKRWIIDGDSLLKDKIPIRTHTKASF